ncbi:MAG: Rieske 2Fe-2S domain-containing protein [Alphaproteobacteria bacterium]|nr:Rieske 2Fe-2S domain-containing protein [Alphaproteobacteria bacterium]
MLTQEQNEKLVRVGPDASMGKMFRLYWIPFYPSSDLLPDARPKRVKLLGEDLVVFRDSDGRPGLVSNACPHRGAPMVFGRNEECGIRCVYHGWKFDVTGYALDVPAEPANSRLKEAVRLLSYPCRERNGIVWTYMGPGFEDHENLPDLPDIEWNLVPEENVFVSFRVQECNWLQALEGEIDSAHAPVLHGRIDGEGEINDWIAARDLKPRFKCQEQPFGMSIASRREINDSTNYWRVNQFLLPFWTLVPPQSKYPELSGHAWIPMDDENTLCLMFSYTPTTPLYEKTRELMANGHKGRETGHASQNAFEPQSPTTPYGDFRTRFRPDNDYHFDYQSQETTWFSGLPGLWVQDAACQSGVMPVWDRTLENLASSDLGIVKTRRLLLDTLKALEEEGLRPAGVDDPGIFMVRSVSMHLPVDADWHKEAAPHMQAELGKDFGYSLSSV